MTAKTIGCLAFAAVAGLTLIICLSLNWHKVGETEVCIAYDKYTEAYDSTPLSTPGLHSIGPTRALLCYPTNVQVLELDLSCRTSEGLSLGLKVDVEYRIQPSEVANLFRLVNMNYEALYKRIALSQIRNSASKFQGMTYLTENPGQGNRANISLIMQADLSKTLAAYHATVATVHMSQVILPTSFEQAFTTVESLKLEQRQVAANLQVELQRARINNQTKVIEIMAANDQQRVEAEIAIKQAQQGRSAALVTAEQEGMRRMVQAQSSRDTSIISAQAQVDAAVAARDAMVTKARIEGEATLRQAESARASILASENAMVARAQIARNGELIEARNLAVKSSLQSETVRANALNAADILVAKEVARREAAIAQKESELLRVEVEVERWLLEAEESAGRKRMEANATKLAAETMLSAEVEGLKQQKEAEKDKLLGLKATGMNNTEVLRFLYIESLKKVVQDGHGQAKVFVDYKKSPMFLEGMPAGATAPQVSGSVALSASR
jgi:regulator of protease activity HflC (stomatin/prohibitin superfamily)